MQPQDTHSPIDILTIRDVAARLSLDRATLTRLRQRGDFPPAIRLSPGRVGFRRVDIEAWVELRQERRG